MKKELSAPVIGVVIALVVALVGVLLYRASTGGTQGDGHPRIEASRPGEPAGPKVAPPRMPGT